MQFNADEVFEMAEEIERAGQRFYLKAAEGSVTENQRKVLTNLARWEQNHLDKFHQMRLELAKQKQAPATWDPEAEAVEYLHAFADNRVFDRTDPSKSLTGEEPIEEILTTAARMEKDSILFYTGLKELIPETLGADRVQGIIKQEMRHLVMISGMLAALGKRGE